MKEKKQASNERYNQKQSKLNGDVQKTKNSILD